MTPSTPIVKTCSNCRRIKGGPSCRQYPDCQPLSRTGWQGLPRRSTMPKVALEGITPAPGAADQFATNCRPGIGMFSR